MTDDSLKRCSWCKQNLPRSAFSRRVRSLDGLQHECNGCKQLHRAADPKRSIFHSKKSAAARIGVNFTLVFEAMEWPEVCPALGTRLEYAAGGSGWRDPRITPSFDRLDPKRGYEPGNVVIISAAANSIKSQFNAREIRAVADWLEGVEKASST